MKWDKEQKIMITKEIKRLQSNKRWKHYKIISFKNCLPTKCKNCPHRLVHTLLKLRKLTRYYCMDVHTYLEKKSTDRESYNENMIQFYKDLLILTMYEWLRKWR